MARQRRRDRKTKQNKIKTKQTNKQVQTKEKYAFMSKSFLNTINAVSYMQFHYNKSI